MNARFYWFTFAIGFGLLMMGMHALLLLFPCIFELSYLEITMH